MSSESSCSVLMSVGHVVSQNHSFVTMLVGAGNKMILFATCAQKARQFVICYTFTSAKRQKFFWNEIVHNVKECYSESHCNLLGMLLRLKKKTAQKCNFCLMLLLRENLYLVLQ